MWYILIKLWYVLPYCYLLEVKFEGSCSKPFVSSSWFDQIRFAMDSILIRLLDYASCIILIEVANGFVLEYALGRRGNLVMGFFMYKIWIAKMTKKTQVFI